MMRMFMPMIGIAVAVRVAMAVMVVMMIVMMIVRVIGFVVMMMGHGAFSLKMIGLGGKVPSMPVESRRIPLPIPCFAGRGCGFLRT